MAEVGIKVNSAVSLPHVLAVKNAAYVVLQEKTMFTTRCAGFRYSSFKYSYKLLL